MAPYHLMLTFTFKVDHLDHLTSVPNFTRRITAVVFKSNFLSPLVGHNRGREFGGEEKDPSPLPPSSVSFPVSQAVLLPELYYIPCAY